MDLAASAGLVLDGWQADVLCDLLGMRPDGKWASFEGAVVVPRQNGKGAIIEARELFGLFLGGDRLILHSAHEYKTAQEAFLRIKALVEGCADLSRLVQAIREANGEQQIILRSGARLRFVARSKGSGRGFSGDLNVLDEAYALTRTQLAALLPTMSARPNPQVLYFSTPPDPDTTPPPEEAVLPGVRKRGHAAAETGDVGRLAYFEWSPPSGFDAADREVWYATNPALGIRIDEEFVEAEFAAMGAATNPAKFATERLGEWPPDADSLWQVVSEAQWQAALDADSSAADPLAFAVDVTPDRGHACIAVAGARADGDVHAEVVEHAAGTTWVAARVVSLVQRWKPCRLVVDAAGAAGSLIADVSAALSEAGCAIEVYSPTAREVAQWYGMTYDALTADGEEPPPWRLWHRDDPRLSAALAGAVTRRVGAEGTSWDRRSTSVDISPLVAVTNAVGGFVTRPDDPPREAAVAFL